MKIILAAALAVFSTCAIAAEWPVDDLNDHIEQTNFIVNDHCSGTLISSQPPLLLTNNHCVEFAVKMEDREVVDEDGFVHKKRVEIIEDIAVSQKKYKNHRLVTSGTYITTVVDREKDWDLALLKFRADNIPMTRHATIYNGDGVLRGETVYAVGNPAMLDASVTRGIVSNVNRLLRVGGTEFPYFQIDAAIEGGSSGGSLYNIKGELIGVPSAKRRGTDLNFAIPYTLIQRFLDRNCFAELYDPDAPPHEECEAE